VVVIVGDVAGISVVGLAGGVGEGVPDGGASTVFVDGAFDLIRSCGRAPKESLRELSCGGRGGSRLSQCFKGHGGESGGGEYCGAEETGEGTAGKSI
jgi:hypothetical protein